MSAHGNWRAATNLMLWCVMTWLLLAWTVTVESVLVGAVVAGLVSLSLAPLGAVLPPWRLLAPRRLFAIGRLIATVAVLVLRANIRLARRAWSRSLPLATGMVVVPTRLRGEGAQAGVSLITSLVVDNQLVDLDLSRYELLYHCLDVPPADRRYDEINGAVEHRLVVLANG
jgi:multisubunit Na+/H+ antiporter MnhE subunit